MKIYHGTSERYLPKILREGLKPRKPGTVGNWDKAISGYGRVYLSSAYALFYAMHAVSRSADRAVVLKIDADKMDPTRFLPDEDWLKQLLPTESSSTTPGRLKKARSLAFEYPHLAWRSLEEHGTIAYNGVVNPRAIEEVALIEAKALTKIVLRGYDPTVNTLNMAIMGDIHKGWHRWLFGEKVHAQRFGTPFQCPEDRSGIEIMKPHSIAA